jgi:hypothetical protein
MVSFYKLPHQIFHNTIIPNHRSSKESIQTGDSAWFERVIQQLRGVLLERQNDAAVTAVEASARPPVSKAAPVVSPKAAPVSTFPTARPEARVILLGGFSDVVRSKKLVHMTCPVRDCMVFEGRQVGWSCKTSLHMPL